MQIELCTDSSCFDSLRAEWNALHARGMTRVPFLRAEYQQAWWRQRGGGEWPPEAHLLIAVAREQGALVGLAPLFHARNRDGRPALLLVGSIEISDYLDVVVARADCEAFVTRLLDRLTESGVPAWDVIDLYNLPDSSPLRAALGRAAAARGWAATESQLEPVPAIPLPDDWETYLATMVEKKERQEIRRKLRRAQGSEEKVGWYFVGSAHGSGFDVAAEIEAFLDMMTLTPDKARFLTPVMREQFRAILRAAAENGWLHLAFLTVGGQRAAAYLSFDFGHRLYVYNSAIDPRFNALSAGWVLLGHLLQWAIENKRAAFDFMRGGEDYKFRFGAVAHQIYRVQVSRTLSAAELGGQPATTHNPDEADHFPPEA